MPNLIAAILVATAFAGSAFVESHPHFEGRIVGGNDTTIEKVPYIVSLMYMGHHHCGASIINSNTIITAAHCVLGAEPKYLSIRVGSSYSSRGGQVFQVKTFLSHGFFNILTMDHDVAVLILQDHLHFGPGVQPIPMPSFKSPVPVGKTGIVSGWGKLASNKPIAPILQSVGIPVWSNKDCNRVFPGKVTDNMICAGLVQGGKDACQMDSGGPFVVDNVLYGVVSWGIGCAQPNMPGVYSSVSQLRHDIDQMIRLLG